MDTTITATVAVAGLIFSLTLGLLLEELLFGLVFHLMACSRRIAASVTGKQQAQNSAAPAVGASSYRKDW